MIRAALAFLVQAVLRGTLKETSRSREIFVYSTPTARKISIYPEKREPGTVMTLDQEGKLKQSEKAYDKRVAGVISGAGGYKPGIVLDKQASQNNRIPIALLGKVFCKVDARYSPI